MSTRQRPDSFFKEKITWKEDESSSCTKGFEAVLPLAAALAPLDAVSQLKAWRRHGDTDSKS